ncbi:MAG: DUF3999 domain-containing protein [Gammaproteobacteria bacterium]|nr:DUF3999 domain-containing protein [Gammaproteobacteria bacterium]
MKYILRAWLSVVAVFFPTISFAEVATDFSCSFPVTEGQQSIRSFTLTEDVYKCLKYNGHSDLVVVNVEGQAVPFRMDAPTSKRNVSINKKNFSFYREPEASSYKTGDQIRRIASLTGISSGNETDTQWFTKNSYYSSIILEQQESDDLLKKVTIDIKSSGFPVSATVIVESSDDLQHWTTLRSPYNLLYLPGVDDKLRSNALKITTASHGKYLRLATLSNVEDFSAHITRVEGEYERSSYKPVPLRWFSVSSLQMLEEKNTWQMSLPDRRPITHIRFTPANNIVFYQGEIYSKPHLNPDTDIQAAPARSNAYKKIKTLIKNKVHTSHVPRTAPVNPWRYLTSFSQYRIKADADTLTSPEIRISSIQSSQWKFHFSQPQGTTASQLPVLELGWTPSRITFIAQGAGPFKLLAGSTTIPGKAVFPAQFASLKNEAENVELLTSSSMIKEDLSSSDKPVTTSPSKLNEALLWVILLVGVALMALMAYQLSKKMKSGQGVMPLT